MSESAFHLQLQVASLKPPMTPTWISECLSRIRGARVGVFGDFRLEARWEIDAGEIGSQARRITRQHYLLAGAGNIAANLASLGANAVHAVGLIGDDLFGRHTLDLMRDQSIRSDGMLRVQREWQTPARGLLLLGDREIERFEFGPFNRVNEVSVERLADALDRTAAWCDVVVLHQELDAGIGDPTMVERINRVIARHARCGFLVDARPPGHTELYRGAMLKVSAAEATAEAARTSATGHFGRVARPVFITQAERGAIVADAAGLHESPVAPLPAPFSVDNIEATTTAAIAAVLAGGGDAVAATRFANLAARVTGIKLDGPATVTPDELRRTASESRTT